MGVDKKFLDQQYKKYGKYLNKVPLLGADAAKNMIGMIQGAMTNDGEGSPEVKQTKPKVTFDKNKYPKI